MRSTVVDLAVCLLVVCISTTTRQVGAQQTHQYTIVQTRPLDRPDNPPDGRNLVKLSCRSNALTGGFESRDIATFYRNSTLFMLSSPDDVQTITFVIDRFVDEARYSCGADQEDSNQTPVIAYPTPNLQVTHNGITTIRAKAGTTAILSPYIRTGNWLSRYYIDWRYSNDKELVGRIDGLRPPPPINEVPEKFRVDPFNFSLMIESVSRAESGMYFGVLGVTEGPGSLPRTFEQTEMMAIVLEVYKEPTVELEREKVVVKKEQNTDSEVVFKCTATGFPRPTIYWEHNFNSDTTEQSMSISDDVVGTLTMSNAHPRDSGKLSCYAIVEPGGNVAPLMSGKAEAELSVLKIFEVKVYKTTGGELVFTVHLGDNVMVPTGLQIQLMEEGDTMPRTSAQVYKGTNPITYVFPNQISKSAVNVLIMDSESDETSEPFTVDLSTNIDQMCLYNKQLVTIVVPVGAGLIVILLVFVLLCCCFCNRERDRICNNIKKSFKDPKSTTEQREKFLGYFLYHLVGSSECGQNRCDVNLGDQPAARGAPLYPYPIPTQRGTDNQEDQQRYVALPLGSLPPPPVRVLNYTRELSVEQVIPHKIGEDDPTVHTVFTQREGVTVTQNGNTRHQNGGFTSGQNGTNYHQNECVGVIRGKGGDSSEPKASKRRRQKDRKCSDEDAINILKDFLRL